MSWFRHLVARKPATTVVINISGPSDPVAAGREIEKALQRYERATGRPLQFRTR